MFSVMESNESPERDLQLAERAAVAPWLDYPPTPWWHAPSGGVLLGAIVLVLGESENVHTAVGVALALAVVLAVGAWLGASVARMGVVPRLRSAPAEFVPVLRGYFAGCGLLALLIVTVYVTVGSRVAAAVAALGAWGGLVLYERRYEKAAEAARKRLA